MSADRDGCCAAWPKPCSYHEGWQDALDTLYGGAAGSAPASVVEMVRPVLARVDRLLTEAERDHRTSEYALLAAAELLRDAARIIDGGRP